ncbi:MAG: MFS transporter [Thermodesulfobacteriota bacterium]
MKRAIHWAWVILVVCFLDLFVNYGIRLGFGVVLPEMITSLDINRTQGGAIFNFYLGAYICLTPLMGYLTDRWGARRVISLCCIALAGGTLFMGTANRFWMACLFFGLVGVGSSGIWTPIMTMIQRWFALERRGMALGILSTGFGLGFATMGWLFPLLVASYSWRACWYVLGVAASLMVVVNAVWLRSSPENLRLAPWGGIEGGLGPIATRDEQGSEGRYKEVFMAPEFWAIGVSYFFIACALYIVTTFMVDYAAGELRFPFKDASLLATIHGLSQVVGVLTIPMFSDRIGRRKTLIGTNLLAAVSILGVLVSGKSIMGLYVSIAFLGVLYGPTWPLYGACGGDYFRKEVMGTAIGAWTPFYGLGAISAHFIGGRIRDVTGSFECAFMLGIIFALVAAFLLLKGVRPQHSTSLGSC